MDQFAVEAMKAFLTRDQATLQQIAATRGAGMSTAVLVAGVSWEMAREMMRARDRLAIPDDDELDP